MVEIHEIELKIFLGNNCNKFALDEISKSSTIGDFTLKNGKNISIADIYFDGPELHLNQHNSYIRIRNKNDSDYITIRVQIAPQRIEEMTHALGFIGVKKALNILREKGLVDFVDLSKDDFEDMLKSGNLVRILSIKNERHVKELWLKQMKLGFVKFDYFFYEPLSQAKFCEIEIDIYDEIVLEGIQGRFKKNLIERIREKGISVTEDITSKYKRGIENKLFINPLFYNL